MPPGATETIPGDAVRVKSAGVTFRTTVAVCVSDPLVPVIVSVELPVGVLVVVVIVRVELPDPLIEAGLNAGVAPLGKPLVTAMFTEPPKPFRAPTLII